MTDLQEILEYLIQGNTLTLLQTLDLFGSISIRERVKQLRQMGFAITTNSVPNPNTGRFHAVYKLEG